MTPSPGAYAPGPITTDAIGQASFVLRLGRRPGDDVFTAAILGTDVSTTLTVRAREAAPGTVLTIVNGAGSSGQDGSGPAVAAAVGRNPRRAGLLDRGAVRGRGLPHPARLAEGVLSVLAGDGSCSGGGTEAAPLSAGSRWLPSPSMTPTPPCSSPIL